MTESTYQATLVMTVDKETKGTVRYADGTANSPVPTLYIRKDAFPAGGHPRTITVTVTGA